VSAYEQPALEGLALGIEARDRGIDRVLNAETQDTWREAAYLWLAMRHYGEEVTSMDLVDAIGMPPSPNAVGAVMRSAAVQGLIESTGRYVQSNRPSCHAAVVRVWKST
jgi:O6-methylguanine-DNA--protein-cysteine methyltransferase